MTTENRSKIISYFVLWVILAFISLKIKDFILAKLLLKGEIVTPLISFYEVHNMGAAFNLFTGKVNALVLSAVVCMIIITALILAKPYKLTNKMVWAFSMLSCGMSLNTFERIEYGYVIDYIYFTFIKNFPVFNIPDILIVAGAFILAFSVGLKQRINND